MASLLQRILDPRKLILVAGLFVAMGFVSRYVDVQNRAERSLALMRGAPAPVAIQDFTANQNVGPASEVVIRAEADIVHPLIVSLRGSQPLRKAVLIPLFPLSERAAGVFNDAESGQSNAAPGDASLASQGIALGYLIHEVPAAETDLSALDALLSQERGRGEFGAIMEINSQLADAGPFTLVLDGALAATGRELASTYIALAPFVNGRDAALVPGEASRLHEQLYWMAFVLLLIAAAVSVLEPFGPRTRHGENGIGHADAPSGPVHHPLFAPIASQEELHEELRRDKAEKRRAPATSTVKAVKKSASALSSVVRTPRSRPEDEAL